MEGGGGGGRVPRRAAFNHSSVCPYVLFSVVPILLGQWKMRKSEGGLADMNGFSVTRGILLEESRVLVYGFVLPETLIDLLMSPEVSDFCFLKCGFR